MARATTIMIAAGTLSLLALPPLGAALALAPAAAAAFSVADDSFSDAHNTVLLKVLRNGATGESAAISTNWGGGVEELILRSPRVSKLRSVLWTHGRNATSVALNTDWRGRMLIPYGNRIGGARYEFNGSTFHLPVNDVMPCDPPLVCVNNSLHGLLWNRPMEVVRSQAGERNASVTLRYDFNGSDEILKAGYPFHLRTEITYTLASVLPLPGDMRRATSRFTVQVALSNIDPAGWPMPAYNGWHPYILANTAKSVVVLDNCTRWAHVDVGEGKQYPPPRFSDMVPTGHVSGFANPLLIGSDQSNSSLPAYHDDEVKALDTAGCEGDFLSTTLTDTSTGEVTILGHESRFLQIWTGAKATFGRDAVVLEPLSSMSDAFNNHEGLHVLSQGERYTNTFFLQVE